MVTSSVVSQFQKFVKTKLSRIITSAALVGFSTAVFADGFVKGRVVSEKSDIGLRGAWVTIEELGLFVKTSLNGEFVFNSVPAGEYTLLIDYVGAKKSSAKITVSDNKATIAKLEISPSSDTIENVLVLGNTASFNKALNRQRSAEAIKNIVNADAIGQYPDANTSEALQRLPGISVENDQGEGRFVRVRGLGPEFNAVTINGARVPSPNAGNRAVALDVIPSDLLESLEVTKTLTPDMDADSLGGSINVQSLSAFDRDKSFYKLSAESHFDAHTEQYSPKFSAAGSKKFALGGDRENFGVAAALSWFSRDFGSDNVETGGAWDEGALEEMEQREYDINRERTGFSMNLDYKPLTNTDLYLRTLYSEYTDQEIRFANVFEFSDPIAPGQTTGAEVARELKDRTETSIIQSVVFGGETRADLWTFEYSLGISESSEETPFHIDGIQFSSEFDEGFSYTNSEIIDLNVPLAMLNAAAYGDFEAELSQQFTEDKENNLRVDIERKIRLGRNNGTVKFGGRMSLREKTSDENVWGFEDENFALQDVVGQPIEYELGQMGREILTAPVLSRVNAENRNDIVAEVDSVVNDYLINEDLTAAYLMGTMNFGPLFVLAGARYEETQFTAQGNRADIIEDEETEIETVTLSETDFENTYSDILPSLHARYKFSEKTQLRAAWTNSLVRPTFEQLSPALSRENDEAEFGNPLLDPLRSSNLDLGIEHYMGYASVLSAFVFHKSIDNFIYQIDLGETAGIEGVEEAVTFRNGDSATINGLELAANKQFFELPEPWNGFFVGANLTWTDSEAEIDFLEDGVLATRQITLPSQSDYTGNFTLGWENTQFSFRLAANYKSEYLFEINSPDDAAQDVYVDAHTALDLLARWFVTENLQVFFQGVNIGDEPFYAYLGDTQFNNQYEEYGPSYRFGVSLTNF